VPDKFFSTPVHRRSLSHLLISYTPSQTTCFSQRWPPLHTRYTYAFYINLSSRSHTLKHLQGFRAYPMRPSDKNVKFIPNILFVFFFFSTVYRYLLPTAVSTSVLVQLYYIQGRPNTTLRNRGGDYIVPSQALIRNPNRRDLVSCEGDNNIVPPSIISFTSRWKGVRVKIDSKRYPCSRRRSSADGIYFVREL